MKKHAKFTAKIYQNWFIILCTSLLITGTWYFSMFRKKHTSKPIVVIIPSYNNVQWYKKNLGMLINQEKHYTNWRAIYIDDCSPDGTGDAVEKFIKDNRFEDKITLIKNKKRCGAMANFYNTIHTCKDNEIIVVCDGDDWFKDSKVLYHIDKVYQDKNVWMTYGQYEEYPSGNIGRCRQIPDLVIEQNEFRSYTWRSSHLRTFYAGLFKRIKKEDFMYNGEFLQATCDMAAMFPMLEMAGKHSKFIPKILYVYNMANPINDHKERLKLVLYLERLIRNSKRYKQLDTLLA